MVLNKTVAVFFIIFLMFSGKTVSAQGHEHEKGLGISLGAGVVAGSEFSDLAGEESISTSKIKAWTEVGRKNWSAKADLEFKNSLKPETFSFGVKTNLARIGPIHIGIGADYFDEKSESESGYASLVITESNHRQTAGVSVEFGPGNFNGNHFRISFAGVAGKFLKRADIYSDGTLINVRGSDTPYVYDVIFDDEAVYYSAGVSARRNVGKKTLAEGSLSYLMRSEVADTLAMPDRIFSAKARLSYLCWRNLMIVAGGEYYDDPMGPYGPSRYYAGLSMEF